jgi:F-type H+-transporting ATPase subunit epsilon
MYKLTVITPEKIVFDEDVYSLITKGGEGYLQILTNHCSILSTLQPGKLTIEKQKGEKLEYAISGGFLEVSHNVATILADALESPDEIDLARAESSQKKAEERLKSVEGNIDIVRAKNALKRAKNRIKIHKEYLLSKQVYRDPRKIEV